MPQLQLDREFGSTGDSLLNLFRVVGQAFVIPPYQREYTWEEENVNQLFDDLVQGVNELSNGEYETAASFLGTFIFVDFGHTDTLEICDQQRTRPTEVLQVVDGQQRLSTIALLAIQIAHKLGELRDRLPDEPLYSSLRHKCNDLVSTLSDLYCVEVGRGSEPPQKPKIIRYGDDRWTYAGSDEYYRSSVSKYICHYISSQNVQCARDQLNYSDDSRVLANIDLIEKWIEDICNAHIPDTDLFGTFPSGNFIVSDHVQNEVLGFVDDTLGSLVVPGDDQLSEESHCAAAMLQLIVLTHYLLERCGVNRLQPTRDEWGFDMFQALNATGTPLTAMETFLPQIMQAERAAGFQWDESQSRRDFAAVEELFESTSSNVQKSRRTNDLLRSFALMYDGTKLGNQFSAQRRWLTERYVRQSSEIETKREFVRDLASVADFFRVAWYMEDVRRGDPISILEQHPEASTVSLLIQYLKDASSRLSAPILARFFWQIPQSDQAVDEFVEATKACAAFFTLWRSSNSTSGLDEAYRRFFRGKDNHAKISVIEDVHNFEITLAGELKEYFAASLLTKNIKDRASWIAASERFMLYSEIKNICRFALFLYGHDRVPAPDRPGLTDDGMPGSCTLLDISSWHDPGLKTIEHVAPQSPTQGHDWDPTIYTDNLVHEVGNLILLPKTINNLVDNKGWESKFLHYAHIGTRPALEVEQLVETANNRGLVLSKKATDAMSNVNFIGAVEPILNVGIDGDWDSNLIKARTSEIKATCWNTLSDWVGW